MAHCPKCQRNSLEYSERRQEAWCLYLECAFSKKVEDHKQFVELYEKTQNVDSLPVKKKRHLAAH